MRTPAWCRKQAAAIGPACEQLIGELLAGNALCQLRAGQGVIGMADRHDPSRLEAACAKAIARRRPVLPDRQRHPGRRNPKRMRNFPQVWIAPCTARGKATGPQREATALLLSGPQAAVAARVLAAKYPVLQGLLVPVFHRLTKKTTVHYELVPPEAA
jgi:hypothetical protein